MDFIFYRFCPPWNISVISNYIFIEDIVSENIHQYSVKSDNLFMNSFIHEHKIPFNYFNCFLYWIKNQYWVFWNPRHVSDGVENKQFEDLICKKQSDDDSFDEEMYGLHSEIPIWASQYKWRNIRKEVC